MFTRRAFLQRSVGLCTESLLALGSNSYLSEVEKWRKEYNDSLRGPEGPFTLIARLFPSQGISTVGSDKSCDLVIPVPRVPAHIGQLEVVGEKATFRLFPNAHATVDQQAVTVAEVTGSRAIALVVNGTKLNLRFSKGSLRLSIIDSDSPARAKATAPQWFPIDEKYRITAEWVAYPQPKLMHLADSDGGSRDWQSPGYAVFLIDGQRLTLQPFATPGESSLFFTFRDATSGKETYGAGRFFEADSPKAGSVVLDFNRAYNPMCAYNHMYTCPIPPKENHLLVSIRAGERRYAGAESAY